MEKGPGGIIIIIFLTVFWNILNRGILRKGGFFYKSRHALKWSFCEMQALKFSKGNWAKPIELESESGIFLFKMLNSYFHLPIAT